jgi:hypothetical protein
MSLLFFALSSLSVTYLATDLEDLQPLLQALSHMFLKIAGDTLFW